MRHLGLDRPLLYARIDLVRGDDGRPLVLEAELCEPSLNLSFAGGSAGRFARAIADRLTG
jgi:O-ureido-D-serine cyclo-ligase